MACMAWPIMREAKRAARSLLQAGACNTRPLAPRLGPPQLGVGIRVVEGAAAGRRFPACRAGPGN